MNAKSKALLGVVTGVLIILIAWAIFSWPVRLKATLEGITYRSGDSEYSEEMTLTLDGHYYRHLFKGDEYTGKIYVEELALNNNLNSHEIVRISFTVQNWGNLYYEDPNDESGPRLKFIGNVIIQPNSPKVIITIHEEIDPGHSTWNSGDGVVFAAPALNRQEAVRLTNELMKDVLTLPIE